MKRAVKILGVGVLAAGLWAPAAAAQTATGGGTGTFVLGAIESALASAAAAEAAAGADLGRFDVQGQVTSTRREDRPEMDPVGGFQLSVLAGVQLKGSASGQAGVALAWFKRSTAGIGLELEGGATNGPSGRVYHGLMSVILQSGARSARMVPYLSLGGGVYHAREKLRPAVAAELPNFGIEPREGTETGALLAFGLGFRYYLSSTVSFRADYREFRALTTGDGGFFDRLFGLRRIGGFVSFEF